VIPEGRPPTPLIYWGDLSLTGNGDLPLPTPRRVESILTPPGENRHFLPPPFQILHPPSSPFKSILERSHGIAIFAFFFRYFSSTRPNEFFQIQAYLIHWFRLLALLFSLFAARPGVGRQPPHNYLYQKTDSVSNFPGVAELPREPAGTVTMQLDLDLIFPILDVASAKLMTLKAACLWNAGVIDARQRKLVEQRSQQFWQRISRRARVLDARYSALPANAASAAPPAIREVRRNAQEAKNQQDTKGCAQYQPVAVHASQSERFVPHPSRREAERNELKRAFCSSLSES
jgi:hypothetical protein